MHIAEDGHARLQAGELLDLVREFQRVARMGGLELVERGLGEEFLGFALGALARAQRGGEGARVLRGAGALGHGDDAERGPVADTALDRGGDGLDVVGDLGDENHVGAAGHAGAEREPAGLVAHDLGHDDAVVAVRGGMEPVDCLGRDVQRGVEADGRVGVRDVVVDRLRQGDDVEPLLDQAQRVLVRAAAADADEGVELVALVGGDDLRAEVPDAVRRLGAVGFEPAGAEERAAVGEDARKGALLERDGTVVDEALEAIAKADHFPAVGADRGLAHGTDRGVEPGAVAAGGEDADSLLRAFHRSAVLPAMKASPRRRGERRA